MLGIVLNMILISTAVLALVSGIVFFLEEPDTAHVRNFTPLFGGAIFLICAGYSVMGLMPYTQYAFIPRIIGLFGIDIFLFLEFTFLTFELKTKLTIRYIICGFLALLIVFDLIIFGRPHTITYVRYNYHTSYENIGGGAFMYHYAYVCVVAFFMQTFGIQWYKSKKVHRDKRFSAQIMASNYVILLGALPDLFKGLGMEKYPTFLYSIAFAFVYFFFWVAVKQHLLFTPTVKNVCKDVFNSINVPILIFNLDGFISVFNPEAAQKLAIKEDGKPYLRNLFTISDIELMRLIARSKNGWCGQIQTKIKETGEDCTLNCVIRFDNVGEPFCIIGTVLPVSQEITDDKGEAI
ncbi:hypothetical protein [Treponema sp. C6A8]|uniref:hypothetical protein n=1 Tax=Treponema sp. C6A8 TaxID=1410609 RepID=UPI00048934A4|nr:hypothetical protein [Treponema sp. C6A8]